MSNQSDQVIGAVTNVHDVPAGVVLSARGSFTNAAELAANAVIEMISLPLGAQPLGGIVEFDAFGAGRTLDIGFTGGDIDAIFDGVDVSSAGSLIANGTGSAVLAAADTVDAKVLGDVMDADTTIVLTIFYVMT